ncbi:uncharacterized protein LOC132545098 [Ylistrum balloti]|uniref:uncharacterized protein LOC132545098 n=1 Tax=Ylistrum balloti TaxID=509963 RepID=UPI002905F29F|nr:uncharacterized protein LOC132545098 [Ylistrum balloti]
MAKVRSLCVHAFYYIDDSLVKAADREVCERNCRVLAGVLESAWFQISSEKSLFSASQMVIYLGYLIDSITFTVSLPEQKVKKIIDACSHVLGQKSFSLRELASLIGLFTSSLRAVRQSGLFYRLVDKEKIAALHNGLFYDDKVSLSRLAQTEIVWWRDKVNSMNGRAIRPSDPDVIMETDASGDGWGAKFGSQITKGLWSKAEREHQIIFLELKAVWLALRCFCSDMSDTHVRVVTDNVCTISYVNKPGGNVTELNELAKEIWLWCTERNIFISACHIPGVLNVDADYLSRSMQSSGEWSLHPLIFDRICGHFFNPDVDLFSDQPCTEQSEGRQSKYGNSNRSLMEKSSVATYSIEYCCGCARTPAEVAKLAIVPTGGAASLKKQPETDRMLRVRRSLQKQGFSRQAATLVFSSWKQSTSKQYDLAWNNWVSWCGERQVGANHPTIKEVISYLTHLFNVGKSYSVINTHKCMLSQTLPLLGHTVLMNNALISRFMKGVFNTNPPKPRYSSTWDVAPLQKYLGDMFPLTALEVDSLTRKLVCLIALTTAQRAQTLVNLDLEHMQNFGHYIVFTVPELMKTSKPSKPFYKVTLYKYSQERLCVVSTLRYYVSQTVNIRKSNKHLVSFRRGLQVSTSTVARWMREVMMAAGIDRQFKPHSVRGASVSAAYTAGTSLRDILETANWASAESFRRFYLRDIDDPGSFSTSVLQTGQ